MYFVLNSAGFIAGVTNPRFEDLRCWDVLCNVETGKITVHRDIQLPQRSQVFKGLSSSGATMSDSRPDVGASDNLDDLGRQEAGISRAKGSSLSRFGRGQSFGLVGESSRPLLIVPEARSDAEDLLCIEEVRQIASCSRSIPISD